MSRIDLTGIVRASVSGTKPPPFWLARAPALPEGSLIRTSPFTTLAVTVLPSTGRRRQAEAAHGDDLVPAAEG